ncbi:hypothetical protein Q0S19_12715 [Stenotrophomonas indicatrix]|nr:hypothetical protein [Stenotrophomonas indicatrix]MDN8645327.1 hypothetical protein [Stenotrophomonas indicatrix]MDN8655836.1 hypothetical protein [Stenotrophomonas indicatrix]
MESRDDYDEAFSGSTIQMACVAALGEAAWCCPATPEGGPCDAWRQASG